MTLSRMEIVKQDCKKTGKISCIFLNLESICVRRGRKCGWRRGRGEIRGERGGGEGAMGGGQMAARTERGTRRRRTREASGETWRVASRGRGAEGGAAATARSRWKFAACPG